MSRLQTQAAAVCSDGLRRHCPIASTGSLCSPSICGKALLLPALTLHVSDAAAGLAQTFWHSSAHVLGEALEACFGAKLTIGPALEEGFYYDCYLGERTLTEADKAALEKQVQQARPAALPACATPALLCAVSRRLWDDSQHAYSHANCQTAAQSGSQCACMDGFHIPPRVHSPVQVPEPCRGCAQIVKEKQEFERVVVTREEALSMFEENKFKAEIIEGLPQDATISLYRCGPMVRQSPPSSMMWQ